MSEAMDSVANKKKIEGKIINVLKAIFPNCPVAESMPKEVEDKVGEVHGVKTSKVNIVFDPPWDKEMMSEEAKLDLGMI